jgi:hypothetical protein
MALAFEGCPNGLLSLIEKGILSITMEYTDMSMKRLIVPLTLLIFILFVTPVQSLQQNIITISSNGRVNSPTFAASGESSGLWWGVVSGSTAWGAAFVGKQQIKIVADAGATSIRIMLDKYDWDKGTLFTGLPYRDYIKMLVQAAHNETLKVLLDLCRDSGTSWGPDFDIYGKDEVITDGVKRAAWIAWGEEVIAYCKPDAIGILNEPRGGGTTFAFYHANFVLPSIKVYQTVATAVGISNFKVFVMGYPFYNPHQFVGDYAINDKNVIYEYHCYYQPFDPSTGTLRSVSELFYAGNITGGTTMLYKYLNSELAGLPLNRVNLAEIGVFRFSNHLWTDDPSAEYLGWREFMKALYDYAVTKGLHGLHQYQLAGNIYTILGGSDCSTFTPYGQVWADSVPT